MKEIDICMWANTQIICDLKLWLKFYKKEKKVVYFENLKKQFMGIYALERLKQDTE